MKKRYKIVLIAAIIGLFGWQLYQKIFKSGGAFTTRRGTATVAVEVTPVRTETIRDIGLFTGSLIPRSQFNLAANIMGRVEKVYVNIGDPVKYNQLIAELDDDEYIQQVGRFEAELEVARANVEEANSSFEVAKREFERVTALKEKKIASESELDAAGAQYKVQEARYKVAVAQVAQRESALEEVKVRLSYTKIRASWEDNSKNNMSRVVGERFIYEGAMVNTNTPIVSILDINSMIAVIYIIERDYPKVQIGMESVITTDAFPSKTFRGKVVRIAPLLKETSREARVEIEIPNPEHFLKPGMFVRAQIVFAEKKNATVVPLTSLARRDDKQGIFLADTSSMQVSFIPVKLGIVNGNSAEIAGPSLAGFVVNMGQHLLEDGSAITIPNIEDRENETANVKENNVQMKEKGGRQ